MSNCVLKDVLAEAVSSSIKLGDNYSISSGQKVPGLKSETNAEVP